MDNNPDIDKLLQRTMLKADQFKSFMAQLSNKYPVLGTINTITPINEGYEDANFVLRTSKGKNVLKIFAEDISITNAKAHAKILSLANQAGCPVVPIVANYQGEYLSTILDNYCFITTYIEGDSFDNKQPSLEDIIAITKSLTKLNKITEKLSVSYDSWSNSELLWEYKRAKETLDPKIIEFLMPTIKKMRLLNVDNFQFGLIHGDIQPKHIIKKINGECLILDFGVSRYDLLVYELSTHLAWFCLPEYSIEKYNSIIKKVVSIYEMSIPLNTNEKKSLPVLIEAAYAAYYFRTEVLKTQDTTEETRDWNKKSRSLIIKWRQFCDRDHL